MGVKIIGRRINKAEEGEINREERERDRERQGRLKRGKR